jgi:hypothetical protein
VTWLLRVAPTLDAATLLWTLGVGALAVTSLNTPPNPRLLLIAFPVVLVFARVSRPRRFCAVASGATVLLVGTSALTFVGSALRP